MGDDFDFRTMLGSRPPRRKAGPGKVIPFRRPRRAKTGNAGRLIASGLLIGSMLGLIAAHWSGKLTVASLATSPLSLAATSPSLGVGCSNPRVVDGDTLRCGSTRIRLSSIDAPEMPGHCRPGRQCAPGDPYASTKHLRSLVAGSAMQCRQVDTDHYGRTVAYCSVNGRDLSCAQYQAGHAIKRYGFLSC